MEGRRSAVVELALVDDVDVETKGPGDLVEEPGVGQEPLPPGALADGAAAACVVCGGRTILSPGPSSMSPPAVWNTIRPRTQYGTFRSRAHASRRYRRGRCPTRAGSGPRHASGLRSRLRLAVCRHSARPQRQRPSQSLITAASVVCHRADQGTAVADCVGRERRIKGHSLSLIHISEPTRPY